MIVFVFMHFINDGILPIPVKTFEFSTPIFIFPIFNLSYPLIFYIVKINRTQTFNFSYFFVPCVCH